MTFTAILKFNDSRDEYIVMECDYEFSQEIDGSGKPCAMPRCGIINVVFESRSDPAMIQWMLGAGNIRSGQIVFFNDDSASKKLKTLAFKQAVCVRFHEKFTNYGDSPMTTYLSFVAKEVTLDGIDHSSQWTNF
ncbi:MAG: type VI secretion system tube protein TssD [Bacteroidales bacterium]